MCPNELLIVVMAISLCEFTQSHLIVHFKRVNCVAYELHLNKSVKESGLSLIWSPDLPLKGK